ncbi:MULTISPECIES: hypothetical protein [Clostridium]|nr:MULTISPECIES: hypothetical protein [Clostridium]
MEDINKESYERYRKSFQRDSGLAVDGILLELIHGIGCLDK